MGSAFLFKFYQKSLDLDYKFVYNVRVTRKERYENERTTSRQQSSGIPHPFGLQEHGSQHEKGEGRGNERLHQCLLPCGRS